MSAEDRYKDALQRSLQLTADAVAEVNATLPKPSYPLRRRIVWRLRRRVPADVRAEQLMVRRARARLLLSALQERGYRP